MCLILLAWRRARDRPLVVAANRDEYHERPAARAAFWDDRPAILAGRDLQAMGTWMGVSRNGRFAAVTNYRGAREASAPESRGALVARYLDSDIAPGDYVEETAARGSAYSGFNLLVADDEELWWLSNRDGGRRRLEPGIYGLGNLLLDSPDVDAAKSRFTAVLDPAPSVEPLFTMLSEARVRGERYGTRCSTVVLKSADGRLRFAERGFSSDGHEQDTVRFEFSSR